MELIIDRIVTTDAEGQRERERERETRKKHTEGISCLFYYNPTYNENEKYE
jgi:hypothetical protein